MDRFTLKQTDVDAEARALCLPADGLAPSMELEFLAAHEEGASHMVQRQDKAIRVVLILQNPRPFLR
jgi:hypothetical protein